MTDISDLFGERPRQWGLRGDPYLWNEMEERFRGSALPGRVGDMKTVLEAAFEALTGHPASHRGAFGVKRYVQPHGGMSTGMVSPEFWRDRGFPLLMERFRAARAAGTDPADKPES